MATQFFGTELALSILVQFEIFTSLNFRENSEVSHKYKDRHGIYNTQIVMQTPWKMEI